MTTKFYRPSTRVFWTMLNEVLTPITITKVTFDLYGNVGSYDAVTTNNTPLHLSADTKMYDSENDFRDGKEASKTEVNFNDTDNGHIFHKWTMQNGEPTGIKAIIKSVEYDGYKYIYKYDGYDASELYDSRSHCLAYNDYQVTDEEGNTITRKGYAKMLQLNDEQTELLNQFKALRKKMEDAGIGIVIDCEDAEIGFYNTIGFKSVGYKCECEDEDIYAEYTPLTWITDIKGRWCDDSLYYQL